MNPKDNFESGFEQFRYVNTGKESSLGSLSMTPFYCMDQNDDVRLPSDELPPSTVEHLVLEAHANITACWQSSC